MWKSMRKPMCKNDMAAIPYALDAHKKEGLHRLVRSQFGANDSGFSFRLQCPHVEDPRCESCCAQLHLGRALRGKAQGDGHQSVFSCRFLQRSWSPA